MFNLRTRSEIQKNITPFTVVTVKRVSSRKLFLEPRGHSKAVNVSLEYWEHNCLVVAVEWSESPTMNLN